MSIKNNITNLQSLLEAVNSLPEASSGVELPELTNEGVSSDLLSGKQLIDQDGEIVTGSMPNNGTIASTMDGIDVKSVTIPQGYTSGGTVSLDNTIDNEVDTQAKLISQIVNALENKAVEVEYKEVEWSENENAMVTGTLSSYTNDIVTTIGNYAFYNAQNLTSVSFPACTNIDNYAFNNCSSLTTVSFPACTSIGSGAFGYCSKLTTASFPACKSIGSNAFYYCFGLTTVSFPVCTTIGDGAFLRCYNLKSVSFPVCTSICSYAFKDCYKLTSIYLTGSSVCNLANSNAFTSTPIGGYSALAGTYGSIYVPASLLTSYQTATNWTYFSSRFVGI